MKVMVGISNRHIHLCEEDYKLLFGDKPLTVRNELKQPGMYACNETVTIKGSKREISNVRVLGPMRGYTQVEVSKTDAYTLGVNPPVRNSGDLDQAAPITIIGEKGEITRNACIIATRHIHISKSDRVKYNLSGVDKVSVKINGEKSGVIDNVYIRESDEAFFEMHLDTDDANAFLLKNEDLVDIIL